MRLQRSPREPASTQRGCDTFGTKFIEGGPTRSPVKSTTEMWSVDENSSPHLTREQRVDFALIARNSLPSAAHSNSTFRICESARLFLTRPHLLTLGTSLSLLRGGAANGRSRGVCSQTHSSHTAPQTLAVQQDAPVAITQAAENSANQSSLGAMGAISRQHRASFNWRCFNAARKFAPTDVLQDQGRGVVRRQHRRNLHHESQNTNSEMSGRSGPLSLPYLDRTAALSTWKWTASLFSGGTHEGF